MPRNPLQLPEGTYIRTQDGVEAIIGSDGYPRKETIRKASGAPRSGFGAALQALANEKTPGGMIPAWGSGQVIFGGDDE